MALKSAHVLAVGIMLAAGNDRLIANTPPPPDACAAREIVPDQLRPLDCRTAPIVTNGMARSATFRWLVDRVGELNGIVYIKSGFFVNAHTKRVLSGALSHQISMAGAHRVLHVMVAPESGDRPVITMAHELQHAIEVLEAPDVATEAAVDQLFERIGMHAGTGIVETQAALNVERAVARELSANRGSGSRGFLQSGQLVVPMTGAEPARLAVRLSIDQGGGLSALQLRLAIDEVRAIWTDVGVSVASGP